MKLTKTQIGIGIGLGVVSIALGAAYIQYKRLMNYCIGLNKIKINSLEENSVNIDLFLNFKNNSNVKFEIESQDYNVYVNDKLIVAAINFNTIDIRKDSMAVIPVNIKFNPKKSGQSVLNALVSGSINVKIEVKLKVKLWMFKVNIPYTYNAKLGDLLRPSQSSMKPKKSMKC